MNHEFLQQSVTWVVGLVGDWGYAGIIIMMFLESSCFPFPGEVVMVPAGYLASPAYLNSPAYIPGHEMNIWIAMAAGLIGSGLGALFNYYLARLLGRPLLMKWGKYLLISKKHFEKGEAFFNNHGEVSLFTARLIPVVRQYISLPAGLARMNIFRFLLWIGLGTGIWTTILLGIGYAAGHSETIWREYLKEATLWALAGVAVVIVVYTLIHQHRKNPASKQP